MDKIEYSVENEQALDLITPLWEKLREYHKSRSPRFKQHYTDISFGDREKELLRKSAGGAMRLDLARDGAGGIIIGYCLSTITDYGIGEIDSIFIEQEYRRKGIGDALMQRAMRWLETCPAEKITVAIGAGNEEVFAFYERYGFYPRQTILEQIKAKKKRKKY